MLKTTVGCELSEETLRIAVVRSFLGRRRLLGTYEIPGFGSMPAVERRRRLLDLRKKHGIPVSRVHLILPHEDGIARQLELPLEVQDKLDDVVRLQVESVSPWPVEDVYWAWTRTPSAKGSGKVMVTIVVVPKDRLHAHAEAFGAAGLPLRGATLAGGAWAQGAATLWEGSAPVIVLGCESGRVDGVVTIGGRFFAAGGAGSDTVALARSVVDRLLALGRVSEPGTAKLVAYGAAVDALPEEPPVHIPLENAPAGAWRRFGAVAAALSGISVGGFAPNVLPSALRYRQSRRQLIPTAVLLLLGAAVVLASAAREPYQSRIYAARIAEEIERVAPEAMAVADREQELLALEQRYQSLAGHASSPDRALESLRAVAGLLPVTDWLSSYSYQDGRVEITGLALDTTALQGLLEADALFGNVEFVGPVSPDPSGKNRFTLRLETGAAP